MSHSVKECVPPPLRGSERMSVGEDASTMSALTLDDDEIRTTDPSHIHTTRSLTDAANKSVITPQTSMKARISGRSKELAMNNLRLQNLPLCGRQNELEALSKAFSNIKGGGRGFLLVDGVSGTGKTSLLEHASFQKKVRSQGGIYVSAKCDLREQNDPFASVQDAMSLLCDKILMLRKRKEAPKGLTSVSVETSMPQLASEDGSKAQPSLLPDSGASVRSGLSLSHSISSLEDVREKLSDELTNNEWEVLAQTVPAMDVLVSRKHGSPDELHVPNENLQTKDGDGTSRTTTMSSVSYLRMDGSSLKENSDQLKYAYRHFIRIVASICPLVIVFDDCQWQDMASMEWVKTILTDINKGDDDGLASLLVVASYRSDEVDNEHRLMQMTQELEAASSPKQDHETGSNKAATKKVDRGDHASSLLVDRIHLENLKVTDLVDLLEELLNRSGTEVEQLAEILNKKTAGNAFFVVQFLKQLEEDCRFSFNFGSMKWTWDCSKIRVSYTATSNVAGILADRMKKSGAALAILPIAATLGNAFSPETLQMIVDHVKTLLFKTTDDSFLNPLCEITHVGHSLEQCVNEGLLEATLDGMYKFCHDKILDTAMSFLNEEVKICIGDFFLEEYDKEGQQFGDAFFPLLSLVNQQFKELGTDERNRFRAVELNALAGEKALQCAAFVPASDFFSNAIQYLPNDHWSSHPDLSLRIYVMAGAAAFNAGTGHVYRVSRYTDEVLEQPDVALLDKVDLCYTMMDVYDASFTAAANQANYDFGLSLLKDFGCHFPKGAVSTLAQTLMGLMSAKLSLKKKLSHKALETMPISTDRRAMSIMKILDKFTNAVFHTKSDLLPLVILRQVHYTYQFGLTPYAAFAYPLLGMLFCSATEDFEM
eukprot:scaffold220_cov169-Amphora_coffeaeformis.AAC.32